MINNILFLQKQPFPYFAVMSISGYLKHKRPGTKTSSLIFNLEDDPLKVIEERNPDLIAFSALSSEHRWLREFIPQIKERFDKPILLGGLHPTLYHEDCLREIKGVDYLCVGDGEYFLDEFVGLFGKPEFDEINGLCYQKGEGIHFNPPRKFFTSFGEFFEDRDVYYDCYPYMMQDEMKQFMSSRGCPWKCYYCYNHVYREKMQDYMGKEKFLRWKEPRHFVDEIKRVVAKYPTKSLFFADDTFITKNSWLKEFCEIYKAEVNLPFSTAAISESFTEEKTKWLSEAGCLSVEVGLETSDEQISREVLGRPGKNEAYVRASELMRKHGIGMITANMSLIPGMDRRKFMENVEFNIRIKAMHPYCSIFLPFPGTKVEEICIEMGVLKKRLTFDDIPEGFFLESVLDLPNKKQLIRLHFLFYWMVKYPATRHFLYGLSFLNIPFLFYLLFVAGLFLKYKQERGISYITAIKWFWRFRKSK